MKIINVPTGKIAIIDGEKGKPLEFLSIGDYGKEKNLKADFMNISREIKGVPHGDIMPLEEKWVITISSQYGCSSGCRFCDVPKVGPGVNATLNDLINQVKAGVSLFPDVKHTKRLNLHYARMGEPTWNSDVITSAIWLKGYFSAKNWGFHPVVSTMMPNDHNDNEILWKFLDKWCSFKNTICNGDAGLQVSINTTDNKLRKASMSGNTIDLDDIAKICHDLRKPVGRKYTLNFALTGDPIDAEWLADNFDSEKWLCKITPMHLTTACKKNNIKTENGYSSYTINITR